MNQIIILVIIPLLLIVTPTLVFATNESSYKWGYEQGKVEWQTCLNTDVVCQNANQICQYNQIFYVNGVGHVGPPPDNQTACQDGFLKGWNHH